MDYIASILNDENEIINCRKVTECGDIEFYGYARDMLSELCDYLYEADYCFQIIKMYIEKEYHGDKERFVKDISHCSDYYNLTDYFRKMFDIKSS